MACVPTEKCVGYYAVFADIFHLRILFAIFIVMGVYIRKYLLETLASFFYVPLVYLLVPILIWKPSFISENTLLSIHMKLISTIHLSHWCLCLDPVLIGTLEFQMKTCAQNNVGGLENARKSATICFFIFCLTIKFKTLSYCTWCSNKNTGFLFRAHTSYLHHIKLFLVWF